MGNASGEACRGPPIAREGRRCAEPMANRGGRNKIRDAGIQCGPLATWTWIGMPRCEEMVPQLPIHPSWRPPPSPAFSKGSLCSPYRGVHGVSSTQQISTIPRGLFGAGNRGRTRVQKKSKERDTGRAAVPFSGYTWWEYRS